MSKRIGGIGWYPHNVHHFDPILSYKKRTISDNVENDYIDLEDNDDGKVDSRVKRLLLVRLYADDSHLDHNPSVTS